MEQLTVAVPYPRTDGGYQWGPVCPVHPTYKGGNQPTDTEWENAEDFAAACACAHPDHKEADKAVALRPVHAAMDGMWMTVEQAMREDVNLDNVRDSFGSLRRGIVYRSGYWGTVNTVHGVFVRVKADGEGRRADWYEIAEENAGDNGRIRRHCTSWAYNGNRNRVLHLLTEE